MVQPYLIALLLAPGIPMLWQGQELCENNSLPGNGEGRVGLLRPVHWEYFYDEPGSRLLWLVRKVLGIRSGYDEFRSGEYSFVNETALRDNGILVYKRLIGSTESVVAINFGSTDRTVPVVLAKAGTYKEMLHNEDSMVADPSKPTQLTIPGNYGRIWRS